MTRTLIVAAVCALTLAGVGSAGPDTRAGLDTAAGPTAAADTYKDCLDKAMTTLAMNQCNSAEYRRVDAELNAVYRKLMAKLSASRKALLIRAEQRWIAFRDDECRFAASVNAGGTLASVVQGGCLIDLTVKRTKELRTYLSQP